MTGTCAYGRPVDDDADRCAGCQFAGSDPAPCRYGRPASERRLNAVSDLDQPAGVVTLAPRERRSTDKAAMTAKAGRGGPASASGNCARCGRRLIKRRGDTELTCPACRMLPAECPCGSLNDLEFFAPPSNPMGVARQLLEDRVYDDCCTLRHWRGAWHEWVDGRWVEAERRAITSWAYQRLEPTATVGPEGPERWLPNSRKISDVAEALAAVTFMPETVDNPSWLPGVPAPFPASEAVVCANGILHVRSQALHPLTPRLFSHVAVPFAYDADAPDPEKWLEFLGQLWPDDDASIATLREFFGYILSGRTDMHAILLFIGPPRSGRGTIARVLTALLGSPNVAGPTLASLGTQFGLQALIGKPLAIIADARLSPRADVGVVVERLLSISGEDMLTVDRKHKEMWTGKLPTRFVIVSNELPEFADASGAIASRFIVLTLQKSFLGEEDRALTEKLLAELPGILKWSLEGLASLTEKGKFTAPESSDDAVATLQDLASPIRAFIRDECQLGGEVLIDDLWAAWQEWAEGNNVRKSTKQILGRNLRAALPSVRQVRPRDGKVRLRTYVGVSLQGSCNGF